MWISEFRKISKNEKKDNTKNVQPIIHKIFLKYFLFLTMLYKLL